MKVLLDINVVLDLFLAREPHFKDVYKIFEAIEHKKFGGYLCAASPGFLFLTRRKSHKNVLLSSTNGIIGFPIVFVLSICNI